MTPEDKQRRLIADDVALGRLCDELRGCQRIGLDTEFIRERTYLPVLETLQVAAPDVRALIDCRGVASLAPVAEVLGDPRIEKVLHAGEQDLELLNAAAGGVPSPIFDTQIAAAMVGYGAQLSLGALLDRALGVSLRRSENTADWSRRPLPAALVDYALDDVGWLLPLHDHLRERLVAMGRLEWVQEEFRDLEAEAAKPVPDDRALYTRVRGRTKLGRRGLAILRELAAWREAEARRRDRPRQSVLRDEVLAELARRAPKKPGEIDGVRWVPARVLRAHAAAIVEAVGRGLAVPKEELPQRPRAGGAGADGVIELMQAVVRRRAEEQKISVALLATRADLVRLRDHLRGEANPDLPLLHGWRWELVGGDLAGLLEGRLSVGIDARSGDLKVFGGEDGVG